jgi:drug/metabolite transporter (DMT)-like permease
MFNLSLLFVALVWGINFSIVKFSLAEFHPLGFTVVRFALASLFLLMVMIARRESLSVNRGDRLAIIGLGLIGISLYNLFFMYGLKVTTAANSALLISLSPLFGALIQSARGREQLTFRIVAGLACATGGVILIVTGRHGDLTLLSSGIKGDLLTLCAALTWAVYTLSAGPLLRKYSAIKVTAYAMASGSALLLPVSLQSLAAQPWSGISGNAWAALAFAAFIAAGVAYVFWYEGVKRIGVTRTMAYHYLMPIAAVISASLILGERITVSQILGGFTALAGVYLVQSSSARA